MSPFGTRRWWLWAAGIAVVFCGTAEAINYGFVGGAPRVDGKCYWDGTNNWQSFTPSGFIGANSVCYFDGNPEDPTVSTTYNGGFTIGYYGSTTTLCGSGTLNVVADTLTIVGPIYLGKVKTGSEARPGTLNVRGGTLIVNGIVNVTDGTLVNSVTVEGGVLDVASNAIDAAVNYVTFTGGTIRNLTTARFTTFSGGGLITNLSGALTLDLSTNALFTGSIWGSGAATVTKTNSGVLTFDPGGPGTNATLALAGLTTTTNIVFSFDLNTPGGANDTIEIGPGGLTLDPGTPLYFGTRPAAVGYYRLFGGTLGSPAVSNLCLMTPPARGHLYFLSATAEPGYITLMVRTVGTLMIIR